MQKQLQELAIPNLVGVPTPVGGTPKDAYLRSQFQDLVLIVEIDDEMKTGEYYLAFSWSWIPDGFNYLTMIMMPDAMNYYVYFKMD